VRSDQRELAYRRATAEDEPFLRRMLWVAANWREPGPAPSEVVVPAELAKYSDGFGVRPGDRGVMAGCGDALVGAAWCRLWGGSDRGYGYVGDDVPELSVAVLPEYRGRGVGAELIERLLRDVAGDADAVSLSVEPDNRALGLYERLGFTVVGESDGAATLIRPLA
jgi:ribosomal protein S18 acetylase RimI-like enzyme